LKNLLTISLMNVTWQSLTQPFSDSPLVPFPRILAQAASPAPDMMQEFKRYSSQFGPLAINLLGAIAILIVGWIVAAIAASFTRKLLKRTDVDNRLVGWVRGNQQGTQPNVEKWASLAVFWVILIIAIVAFLNALQLTAVAEPLKNFRIADFHLLTQAGGRARPVGNCLASGNSRQGSRHPQFPIIRPRSRFRGSSRRNAARESVFAERNFREGALLVCLSLFLAPNFRSLGLARSAPASSEPA
jgi:hypothetical protein